ncbi:unnamed protein product [Staurois parvus]|uniref:Uncharacterized protein n=1 Tax=Staurois parvus TaxID=386267 RepID=A0ABN9AYM8_9NEOB|nr:unnamed protein product [Staurois parvus]
MEKIDSDTLTPYRNLTHTMIQSHPDTSLVCYWRMSQISRHRSPLLSAAPSSSW